MNFAIKVSLPAVDRFAAAVGKNQTKSLKSEANEFNPDNSNSVDFSRGFAK